MSHNSQPSRLVLHVLIILLAVGQQSLYLAERLFVRNCYIKTKQVKEIMLANQMMCFSCVFPLLKPLLIAKWKIFQLL